ncbi:MAG: Holliday junction branch migration protein RuvA [Muribaculaceae bacterium]|nr:Holliday junction branch migration protein RuvA [Muribaculaceae bacterium]
MIEAISGNIAALNPAAVTIETAGGVAYLLNISLATFTRLEGIGTTRLLVHESIREDAWVLYGFIDEDERELFRALVGVSGVGAASARMILSAFSAADIRNAIAAGDVKLLKSIKGIGAKTAERIIVDLKDKVKANPDAIADIHVTTASTQTSEEALEALVILGFQRQASQKALKKLFEAEPDLTVEQAVKKAMKMM